MENIVITEQGKQLMSKVISETESMTFTKIAVSDYDYSGIELQNISELQSVKQTAIIAKISRTDGKTVDSLDWKNYGVDSILTTVLNHKHLGKGSIILCHNGAKYTAKALPKLIDSLKEKGFEFVKMSELIYTKNYEMDTEGRQHSINNTAAPKQTAFEQS